MVTDNQIGKQPSGAVDRTPAARPARNDGALPATVLIADDHPLFRQRLAEYLQVLMPTGRIRQAGDGREAVTEARRDTPDLVLMDIRMPVMDGIEATRRIKALLPAVKVVILTMLDDLSSRQAADRAGADAYLQKGDYRGLDQTLSAMME